MPSEKWGAATGEDKSAAAATPTRSFFMEVFLLLESGYRINLKSFCSRAIES
jgi:hypothetical protein